MRSTVSLFVVLVLLILLCVPLAGLAERRTVPSQAELAEIVNAYSRSVAKKTQEREKLKTKSQAKEPVFDWARVAEEDEDDSETPPAKPDTLPCFEDYEWRVHTHSPALGALFF